MIRRKYALSLLSLSCAFAATFFVSRSSARADDAMPQAGQEAPSFQLPSQDGSAVSLSDLKGKWVVLYFYP